MVTILFDTLFCQDHFGCNTSIITSLFTSVDHLNITIKKDYDQVFAAASKEPCQTRHPLYLLESQLLCFSGFMCHSIQWEVGLLSEWPSPRWDAVLGLTSLTYSWLVASPPGIALFASAAIGKLKPSNNSSSAYVAIRNLP